MTIRPLATSLVVVVFGLGGCVSDQNSTSPTTAAETSISSRRMKEDITYVSPAELEDLKEALAGVRLATFRYKHGDGARHLGFILEDSPTLPASDMAHAKVDLYAYASMAVAALQVQARQIEQLEVEVDMLSNEVEALTGKRHPFTPSCAPTRDGTPTRAKEIACR